MTKKAMTKEDLRARLFEDAEDLQAAIYALEDGEALKALGCSDRDQDVVEDLHFEIVQELEAGK